MSPGPKSSPLIDKQGVQKLRCCAGIVVFGLVNLYLPTIFFFFTNTALPYSVFYLLDKLDLIGVLFYFLNENFKL